MKAIGIDTLITAVGEELIGANTVWMKYVPIIVNDNPSEEEPKAVAYIYDDIVEVRAYSELIHLLDNAEENDKIVLKLSTNGGDADTAEVLYNAIIRSKAHVIGDLSGIVASAGTMITMACDEIIVDDQATFMIHESMLSGVRGKTSDVHDFQVFYKKKLKHTFTKVYGGFLTSKELDRTLDGKELWFMGYEVQARINKLKEKQNKGN